MDLEGDQRCLDVAQGAANTCCQLVFGLFTGSQCLVECDKLASVGVPKGDSVEEKVEVDSGGPVDLRPIEIKARAIGGRDANGGREVQAEIERVLRNHYSAADVLDFVDARLIVIPTTQCQADCVVL